MGVAGDDKEMVMTSLATKIADVRFGQATRARWATVQIETEKAVYTGRIYIPESKRRLSDVLTDDRPFVNLTEVSMNGTDQVEPYLAINKRFIKIVRVLDDGVPEAVPANFR